MPAYASVDTADAENDIVTAEWLTRHGVRIDRRTGEVLAMEAGEIALNSRRKVNYAKSLVNNTLDYYHKRHWINQHQHDAGEKFYRLWYYGCVKLPYSQMHYSAARGEGDEDFLKRMKVEYNDALRRIVGAHQRLACYAVCCYGEWAVNLEREGFVPGRQAMHYLRDGLTDLANHFRL